VLARGQSSGDLLCGLGTSNPNARVSFTASQNNDDPADAFTTTLWYLTGGKNVEPADISDKHRAHDSINLVFYFATLDVGATLEFDFVYLMDPDDLGTCHACDWTLRLA